MAKSFEESIKELESIVDRLEEGDVSLEESIKLFETGMKLSNSCKKILETAERKISVLTENSDGDMTKEPFSPTENN